MLPEQFLERMQKQLGEEFPAFLQSYDQEKYQALRVNTLKGIESGESERLKALTALFHLQPVPWAENGYYYEKDTNPGKHVYHEAGVYYIQEPSAMAPVGMLDVAPGDRVLDLCAAPGGKSTQIAALLNGEGLLISNEIHPARAKILSENMERMGVKNACVTNETPERLSEVFPVFFDRILVDAPCSGEGMFRKNEEAVKEWSPENVTLCAERQAGILDCAAGMLRPGGRLVYSTCTFAPEENEGSIESFLKRHPEFSLVPVDSTAFYGKQEEMPLPGTLRLYPHKLHGEGHYLAVLEKAGDEEGGYRSIALTGGLKVLTKKELEPCFDFYRETLCEELVKELTNPNKQYISFGENVYLVPEDMPGLKGLKVLRPGWHIGSFKKNRFEPSHAFALSLCENQVKHAWNMEADSREASGFVNGQTFHAEGEKGWYLICVDGFSIGWGKLAGGIMKNHYPKGLRK